MFDTNNHDEIERLTIAEWVAISDMFVDNYGRPVGEAQVNRMLRQGLDTNKLGVIMLSLRDDGRFAILDGNHRVQVGRKVGIIRMFARVFIDLTYEQEAELFVAFNTVNRPTAVDRFRARLEMNELQATEIQAILKTHGMTVALTGSATGAVNAVAALDRLYTDLGPTGLYDVVNVIHRSWGLARRAWCGQIIDGMRQFWMRYKSEADMRRLTDRLTLVTPEDLLRESGVVRIKQASTANLVGRMIHERYNSGLRARRLSDWIDHPGKRYSSDRDRGEQAD